MRVITVRIPKTVENECVNLFISARGRGVSGWRASIAEGPCTAIMVVPSVMSSILKLSPAPLDCMCLKSLALHAAFTTTRYLSSAILRTMRSSTIPASSLSRSV